MKNKILVMAVAGVLLLGAGAVSVVQPGAAISDLDRVVSASGSSLVRSTAALLQFRKGSGQATSTSQVSGHTKSLHNVEPEPVREEARGAVREAAAMFLTTLDAARRERASFAFDDEERYNWHFFPRDRVGLPLGAMDLSQRRSAHHILRTVLSAQGYLKATGVMQMEALLFQLENESPTRNPENYFFSIFGDPSGHGPWGLRVEGHHFSFNYTDADRSTVSVTPTFMGTNPAEVRTGPHAGLRVLGAEEDRGRSLMRALDADQQRKALISEEAPSEIITAADRQARLERFEGLQVTEMTDSQRNMLMALIREYTHNMQHDLAHRKMAEIEAAGIENLYFGWAGGLEPGEPHYYRIHGPTVLFEYDNVQNGANHAHTVWRDFDGDFGEDLLRAHYDAAAPGHGH